MNNTGTLEYFDVSSNDECIADTCIEDSVAYTIWFDSQYNVDNVVHDDADGFYRNRLWGVSFR
jgi:hypothetical protein